MAGNPKHSGYSHPDGRVGLAVILNHTDYTLTLDHSNSWERKHLTVKTSTIRLLWVTQLVIHAGPSCELIKFLINVPQLTV